MRHCLLPHPSKCTILWRFNDDDAEEEEDRFDDAHTGHVSTNALIWSWGILAYLLLQIFLHSNVGRWRWRFSLLSAVAVVVVAAAVMQWISKMASNNSSTLKYMRLSSFFPYWQNALLRPISGIVWSSPLILLVVVVVLPEAAISRIWWPILLPTFALLNFILV